MHGPITTNPYGTNQAATLCAYAHKYVVSIHLNKRIPAIPSRPWSRAPAHTPQPLKRRIYTWGHPTSCSTRMSAQSTWSRAWAARTCAAGTCMYGAEYVCEQLHTSPSLGTRGTYSLEAKVSAVHVIKCISSAQLRRRKFHGSRMYTCECAFGYACMYVCIYVYIYLYIYIQAYKTHMHTLETKWVLWTWRLLHRLERDSSTSALSAIGSTPPRSPSAHLLSWGGTGAIVLNV